MVTVGTAVLSFGVVDSDSESDFFPEQAERPNRKMATMKTQVECMWTPFVKIAASCLQIDDGSVKLPKKTKLLTRNNFFLRIKNPSSAQFSN